MLCPLIFFAVAGAAPAPGATLSIARSVYRIDPVLDGAIIGVGALGTLLPYIFASDLITPRCPCDPAEINAFDRHVVGNHDSFADVLSTAEAGLAIAVPVALDALDLGLTDALVEDLVVYAEVLAVNGALNTFVKYATKRPLPVVYSKDDPDLIKSARGYRSFYSGHTSLTVAALSAASMTLAKRHGQNVLPWVVTGAVGASVAVERVLAGRHFYSDVMVGALAGLAVGTIVPWLHQRADPMRPSLIAVPNDGGATLALQGRF